MFVVDIMGQGHYISGSRSARQERWREVSAGAAEQIHAKCSRLAVHMEKYNPYGDHPLSYHHI